MLPVFDCFEELDENVAKYAESRELLLNELPRTGMESLAPSDGAFYIYADVSHLTDDRKHYAVLLETGVAITPADFDNEADIPLFEYVMLVRRMTSRGRRCG